MRDIDFRETVHDTGDCILLSQNTVRKQALSGTVIILFGLLGNFHFLKKLLVPCYRATHTSLVEQI
jgi:hypothetical protein